MKLCIAQKKVVEIESKPRRVKSRMTIKTDDIDMAQLEIYNSLRENAFSKDGSFIADSPKVVNLLLNSDLEFKSVLATKEYYEEFEELVASKNIPKLYLTTKEEMKKIVGHKIHHNCMAHGIRPAATPLDRLGDNVVMLDNVTSSENVGAIARSAAALGVDSFVLGKTSPHPFNRRALRVSMGHSSLLKTYVYEDLLETIRSLKSMGYRVYAAEVTKDSTPLSKVEVVAKWVLLMGHEGEGIAQDVLDACDEVVSIEMQEGVKSFNVAIAASIMMYKFKNIV